MFEISSLLFEIFLNFAVITFKYTNVQSKWNDYVRLYAHPEGEILIPSPEIDYAFGIGLFSIFLFKLLLETHKDTINHF